MQENSPQSNHFAKIFAHKLGNPLPQILDPHWLAWYVASVCTLSDLLKATGPPNAGTAYTCGHVAIKNAYYIAQEICRVVCYCCSRAQHIQVTC